jgi:uncharacterized paraquat-inducible protein A
MATNHLCPFCNAENWVEDSCVGTSKECKQCGKVSTVYNSKVKKVESGFKTCPHCAEKDLQPEAKVCKHCGRSVKGQESLSDIGWWAIGLWAIGILVLPICLPIALVLSIIWVIKRFS